MKQRHVSLSKWESEFAALSYLCTEIVWYKQLLTDLGMQVVNPIIVNEDNQSAIQMASS